MTPVDNWKSFLGMKEGIEAGNYSLYWKQKSLQSSKHSSIFQSRSLRGHERFKLLVQALVIKEGQSPPPNTLTQILQPFP